MADRSYLRRLAERAGILSRFVDGTRRLRGTSDATRVALLAAMGVDGSTEQTAHRSLQQWTAAEADAEPRRSRRDRSDTSRLSRCLACSDVLGDGRVLGLWVNLYSVRTQRGWGVGEFTDLRALMPWAARHKVDFVGVNPLHAVDYTSNVVSPYSPLTRLFDNPVYVDVTAVPEWPALRRSAAATPAVLQPPELEARRTAGRIDYQRI
ncbi:MAG: 4-alpha-glucanotransferase, partial [Chloroflexi bacterium]|nr:4-alpha-glucanotransferase [Chloroflexota bacterium]